MNEKFYSQSISITMINKVLIILGTVLILVSIMETKTKAIA